MRYLYCPQCGTKLTEKNAGDDGPVPFCDHCEKFWFDSFTSCVIVMVYNEYGEIALCKQEYLKLDYMNFTSGYITPGESAEESAIREVKEELGLDVQKLTAVGTNWFAKNDMLMHGYIAYVPKEEFKLSGEVDDAQWIPYKEATKYMVPDVPGNSMWILYRYYRRCEIFSVN